MLHTAGSAKNKTIYLDHAATTPLDPAVLEKMLPYFGEHYSNASSMHSSGRRAGGAIAQVRRQVADIIGAMPGEIIFTGSGTESDNLAVLGVARAHRKHGNHIIISSIEHKAILESAKRLEKDGWKIDIIPVDPQGLIDIDACMKLVTDKTVLISVMYANNEIGTIQPIAELSAALSQWRVARNQTQFPFLHTDACQAAGALSLDVRTVGVDLMTLNGSKIYGPKGVGMLYKKKHVAIEPIIIGGEQEQNLRAGTESVPLIVGFGEALAGVERMRDMESKRLIGLRDYFMEGLLSRIPGAVINGHRTKRLPNNIHISIPHIEGESILLMLDKYGIEASTGSACSAYDLRPSHVLMAIGQTSDLAHGSIRFTLGKDTGLCDIDHVLEVLPQIAVRLSHISALTAVFA